MDIQKILVMKLRHLGDVLLATPVFSALRKAYPNAQIHAYIWKEALPILEGHPAIDKIHTYDRSKKKAPLFARLSYELSLLRLLRKEGYDLVMNLTEGDRGAVVALASKARVKVGFVPKKGAIAKVFTHLVKHCPNPRHTVERDLDAVRILGHFPQIGDRELFFGLGSEDEQKAKELAGEGEYVVVHAPSRWKFKCLPPKLMAEVIDGLGMRVVLTGSPSERAFVQEIVELSSSAPLNCAGKTTLKEMGALMKGAKGVITVDSVSLHIASALKVPTVALFGPTSEANWGPYRNPRSMVIAQKRSCRPCRLDGCGGSKVSDCLHTLDAEEIVRAFQRVISAKTPTLVLNQIL